MYTFISVLAIVYLFFILCYAFYDVYLFKRDGEDYTIFKDNWFWVSYLFLPRFLISFPLCLSITSVRNLFFHDILLILSWLFYIALPFFYTSKLLFLLALVNFFTLISNIMSLHFKYANFWDYLTLPQYIFYTKAVNQEKNEIKTF